MDEISLKVSAGLMAAGVVLALALEAIVSSTQHISTCKMQMTYLGTSSEARIRLQTFSMMRMISSAVLALAIPSEAWVACMEEWEEVWEEVWVEEWVVEWVVEWAVAGQKVKRRIEIHLQAWVWVVVLETACLMMMMISSEAASAAVAEE